MSKQRKKTGTRTDETFNSGLRLVPKRKPRKVCTTQALAAIDWEPWVNDADTESVLSAETFQEFGVAARLTYSVMLLTREKLIDAFETQTEGMMEMEEHLADQAERMKAIAQMIEAASIRVLAAAAAVATKKAA